MPQIIDYSEVTAKMSACGFASLYHNSGAFGFAPGAAVHVAGWVGADDPSIRESAMQQVTRIPPPYDANLANLLVRICQLHLENARVWLMPKSHWHYELHFGNRELLEGVLGDLSIQSDLLVDRNDGSAIEFAADERGLIRETARRLISELRGSDFLLAFPDRATICTIHHHQQLWWQTADQAVLNALDQLELPW